MILVRCARLRDRADDQRDLMRLRFARPSGGTLTLLEDAVPTTTFISTDADQPWPESYLGGS